MYVCRYNYIYIYMYLYINQEPVVQGTRNTITNKTEDLALMELTF